MDHRGFTLIELMVVVAIMGVLVAIATPSFLSYRERARVAVAIVDIQNIQVAIENFYIDNNAYPNSLADIGMASLRDPWGNPYVYLRINGGDLKGNGQLRKDHGNVPVNSDFDLYSKGADGNSQTPFTAKASQDDVVRAYNGSYYGKVADL
ncbi:prepilin-type N-terminal cleavage/methylation domain-containing protein [Desulfosarcina cetonica]|uniref:prepilin-type N-terminal cleavage/methylation domain-containing protein n=1 Tax=Desulfosarcina cetonica TaxID=90730 RepID=UPI0006CF7E5E|nr:prepilin-type N-terminal cleavage/methylation domain-containing protein [Desulfosarcina cetonica]